MRIILALALLLQAAGGRQVQVTVVDRQGLAVEGARVTATEQNGTKNKTVVSTPEGASIDGLGDALYDIRVDAPGFATQTTTADLRSQTSANLKIELDLARLSEERVNVVT